MRLLAISTLICVAAWMTAADQPEPATIIRADNGASIEAQVISENLDEVIYRLGEGAAAADTLPLVLQRGARREPPPAGRPAARRARRGALRADAGGRPAVALAAQRIPLLQLLTGQALPGTSE